MKTFSSCSLLEAFGRTKNHRDKTLSICKQCSRTGIDKEQFEQFANEAHDLNKLLSGSKQDVMSRDRVRELMNRGFLFLRTFLGIIDEKKYEDDFLTVNSTGRLIAAQVTLSVSKLT